jgi:hypothetical protein
MEDGTAKGLYISGLPTGSGKSTIMKLSVLATRPETSGIILLFTAPQVVQFRNDLKSFGCRDEEFSILISKKYHHLVGNFRNPDPTRAKILITTQQKFLTEIKKQIEKGDDMSFERITDFHYKNRPRNVRGWDETITPFEAVTVRSEDVMHLIQTAKKKNMTIARLWMELINNLEKAKQGDIVTPPEVSGFEIMETVQKWYKDEKDQATVSRLFMLEGLPCRVRKELFNTVLNYEKVLPDDFAPAVFTDASARHRTGYDFWAENKDIKFLPSPGKSYENAEFRPWNRASGMGQYHPVYVKNDYPEIRDGVVREINGLPKDWKVLIGCFKPEDDKIVDIEGEIRPLLDGEREVSFLTWGRHTATNDFRDYDCIFVIGMLFYSDVDIEVMGRGFGDLKTENEFPEENHRVLRYGETAHNFFQMVSRIKIRKSLGDGCPSCRVYTIFSDQRRLRHLT